MFGKLSATLGGHLRPEAGDVSPAAPAPADPLASYRIVGTALALVTLYLIAGEVWRNIVTPGCRDFLSFWGAARLALAGTPALAYDSNALHAVQRTAVVFGQHTQMPFPYPPSFMLILAPFGFLPYGPAMALWLAATGVFFLVSLNRLVPKAWLLALGFPPVLVNCVVGQNGFLTAGLFFAAMAAMPRRPFLAGLLIGCLIVKPQLALLIPLALLASRQWRAIAGAAASSMLVLLLGVVLFGWQAFADWSAQLPLYGRITRDGTVGWIQLASVYASARQAGLGVAPALLLHLGIAASAAITVWHIWRRESDAVTKAAFLVCATALASPYLFLYDQVMLVFPFIWLASRKVRPEFVALLWCLPIISIGEHFWGSGPVNLNPLPPIGLLIAMIATWAASKKAKFPGKQAWFGDHEPPLQAASATRTSAAS